MNEEWISEKNKAKLEPYLDVIVKNEKDEEWVSYIYPSGEWKFNKKPTFWKKLIEVKKETHE